MLPAVRPVSKFSKQLQAEIDMIICDHHMLDGNGDEVYKFLEGNPLQEKFIVMTGDSDLEEKKTIPRSR
jgi:response regulator RpfG family c-di-GMP phosphodiesterase